MKKVMIGLVGLTMVVLLAACGSSAGEAAAGSELAGLNENYQDALSVVDQMAFGILELEETNLAVDEAQASGMLPLWQAYQSMNTRDATASAELNALVGQIQDLFSSEQVEAVAAKTYTNEDLSVWMEESGDLFGFAGMPAGGEPSGTGPVGGDRTFGGGMGMGGGGRGGDMIPGTDMGGEQPDADVRATRMAEMGGDAGSRMAQMQSRMLINGVVRTLEAKTS